LHIEAKFNPDEHDPIDSNATRVLPSTKISKDDDLSVTDAVPSTRMNEIPSLISNASIESIMTEWCANTMIGPISGLLNTFEMRRHAGATFSLDDC
jgi:hypothetical protein